MRGQGGKGTKEAWPEASSNSRSYCCQQEPQKPAPIDFKLVREGCRTILCCLMSTVASHRSREAQRARSPGPITRGASAQELSIGKAAKSYSPWFLVYLTSLVRIKHFFKYLDLT
jgi:hypothetical protein